MAGDTAPKTASTAAPALTIGIPAYNAGGSLEAAIRSILRQTWRGTMEILVVDDGSTDDTVAVASRLAAEYGAVRVVRHDRNRGRPTARNTILREAQGRYLTWMDADDEWYPNKLALQFDRLFAYEASGEGDASRPIICMCAFDWKWTHAGRPSHRIPDITGDQLKGLLNGRIGAYLWTMLGTLQAFRDVGDFDEKLPRLQDLDFTIRFVARGGQLIMSDPRVPLCLYHKDDDGKPGRVIAESMGHIRRKHRPLFLQYGPRFLRGARRHHFLLISRHGYRNEGRLYGLGYALMASVVVPGRILGGLLRLARLRPPLPVAKPPKLDTLREKLPDLAERVRNAAGPGRVDLIVMLSELGAEDLRGYLRQLGHASRQAGIWYMPPAAINGDLRRRDHAALLSTDTADVQSTPMAASRLARMAAVCNDDGHNAIVYVGAPVDLDALAVEDIDARIATLATSIDQIESAMRDTGVELRVHLVAPDSETLLWRRYARSLADGHGDDFDAWLTAQPPSLARLLDLRVLAPLAGHQPRPDRHLHLLGDGATLGDLKNAIAGVSSGPRTWPRAAAATLGSPTRHAGLPFFERLLLRYQTVLGDEGMSSARRRFWLMPTHETPAAPAAESLQWLREHGHWMPLAERFAGVRHRHVGSHGEPRVTPEQFRYPVASFAAYERSAAEWRMVQGMALGPSLATAA